MEGDSGSNVKDITSNEQKNTEGEINTELFHEEVSKNKKPWWKTHFFVQDPVLFGTWDGVFTSCLINIFGVVLFLRTGWMVGNVGVGLAVLIVFMTVTVALLASLAAIGICERLKDVHSGGVYFVVSHVLGGKIGGTVGVMYAFGLCIVSALYCTGFAESVTSTFDWNNEWAVRGVAVLTLLLLLAINLAGVKWVIRLQLVLLFVLIVSTFDFILGTMIHTEPDAGFVGFSSEVLHNNTYPSYQENENFFTVFGVFFPTATGVMAGVNMSGDLKKPASSIPVGTLSAIMLSFILYLLFVLLLGSTCLRWALQEDFMIAEKVSAVSVLWLAGLYMSSTSSCSTGLYGAPRVLQSIANQNVVPVIKILGKGFGANKTPVLGIIAVGFCSLLFILIGNLNAISPVITCNFMLVYAVVDYSYFALAMTYDMRMKNLGKYKVKYAPKDHDKVTLEKASYGSFQHEAPTGTMLQFSQDLDKIFQNYESRSSTNDNQTTEQKKQSNTPVQGRQHLRDTFLLDEHMEASYNINQNSNTNETEVASDALLEPTLQSENQISKSDDIQERQVAQKHDEIVGADIDVNTMNADTDNLIKLEKNKKKRKKNKDNKDPKPKEEDIEAPVNTEREEILQQPRSWYGVLCNRWSSLFGVVLSLVVMFLIQWLYALMNILAFALVYIYISQACPGVNPGVTNEFSLEEWIKQSVKSCCRSTPEPPEQILLAPMTIAPVVVVSEQLTSDNEDFADRRRFHQASTEECNYANIMPIMSSPDESK
ncbi:solute carrier family 12 member 8-like isoform X1 [Styela clava]